MKRPTVKPVLLSAVTFTGRETDPSRQLLAPAVRFSPISKLRGELRRFC